MPNENRPEGRHAMAFMLAFGPNRADRVFADDRLLRNTLPHLGRFPGDHTIYREFEAAEMLTR